MKESYREDLASYSGLEPYAGDGNVAGVASARGNAGQPTQRVPGSEIITSVCRSSPDVEPATSSPPILVRNRRTRRSQESLIGEGCVVRLLRPCHEHDELMKRAG